MKTTILYRAFFLLLMMPSLIIASNNTPIKEKHTKEKTIKKSFNVSANATLKVDNSYGNLDIITWNENHIDIEITITVNGNNEDKVQQKLDDITVDFNATTNEVSAKTIFKKSSNSWWNWGNNNSVNMKVNYVIKMPISNSVNLSNDYGNINLDKLEGHATINCDYGKITTKELLADNNVLNFDYTKNCYFEYIKSGKIDADYSGFTIAKTNDVFINADYTSSSVETAENVKYNCDYGSIKIDRANNVEGTGDYLTVVLGDIYKNVSIEADYGSIKIDRLKEHAGNVSINSEYTGIKIGYEPSFSFNFDIDLEYAGLSDEGGFEFTKKNTESTSKHYVGYYGSKNASSSVRISSEYGSVSFFKN